MPHPATEPPSVSQIEDVAGAAWSAVLERARRELTEAKFSLWFSDLSVGSLQGDTRELLVPSSYVKNWLTGHYMDLIQECIKNKR